MGKGGREGSDEEGPGKASARHMKTMLAVPIFLLCAFLGCSRTNAGGGDVLLRRGGPLPAGVYRAGVGGVTMPTLLERVEPEYSEEARTAKLSGVVVLYCEVTPAGVCDNIRVLRALGLGLDEKAIEAVKKWKFNPGRKNGKPVTVAAQIEVNFRLL